MQDPDRCRGRGVCSPAEVGGGMPVSPPSEPPRRRQWLAVSLWCGSLLLLVLLLLLSTPGLLLPSAPWEPLPSPFSPSIRQGKEGSAPAPPRMNVSISRSTVPPPQSGEGKLHGHYLDALPSDFPVPSPEEIRRHKRHFSDTVLDPYELLLLTDFVQEDLQHSPLCYTFGYQIFAVMRLSPFSSAGIHINAASEESTALWAHTRRGGKENASVKANETLLDLTLGEVPQHVFSPSPAPGLPVQSTPIMNFSSISATAPLNASVSLIGFLDRYMVDEHVPTSFRGVLCDWFVQLLHLPDHPRPAVINLPKTHTFAFSLRCLYARTDALRTALRQFVLVTTEQDETAAHGFFRPLNMNPSEYPMVTLTYLLNHPLLAHWYSTNANIRHPKFTAIPIGFHFFHHSGQRSMPIPDWDSVFQSSTSEGWGENPSTERWGEEHRQKWDASRMLQGLNLTALFPHIHHPLQLGRRGCVWLEKALEVFGGSTVDPPIQWIPLDKLPQRITTIYVVLMPIERERRPDRPSLTNEVLVFEESGGRTNQAVRASKHIALLPFTAALYHKLRQHPYGEPGNNESKPPPVVGPPSNTDTLQPAGQPLPPRRLQVLTAFLKWSWRETMYNYLAAHQQTTESSPSADDGFAYFIPDGDRSQDVFYRLLPQFHFVASPIGYGYDCYRTWEALAFGAIPIVESVSSYEALARYVHADEEMTYEQRCRDTDVESSDHPQPSPLSTASSQGETIQAPPPSSTAKHARECVFRMKAMNDVFDDLPVVVVENVTEITMKNLERWRREIYDKAKRGEYKIEKLFLQNWIDKIYGHNNE